MKLSKRVPGRTVTLEATNCIPDFLQMTQRYRQVRSRHRDPMDKCHWCQHAFVDGEMMALAIRDKGNKVLCQTCAKALREGQCESVQADDPGQLPSWLLEKTFVIEYSPNCNNRWMVRLVGFSRGKIDKQPPGKSDDAIGFGKTVVEAADKARQAYDVARSVAQDSQRGR